jgi:hypothetical protein
MTHLLGADIYLGDISSQVFEFLVRPRPCLFLNPHRLPWRDDPDFASWHLGPVVETIGEMAQRLAAAADWQPEFAPRQARAFAEAFAEPDPLPAPERAAGSSPASWRTAASKRPGRRRRKPGRPSTETAERCNAREPCAA